MVEKPSFKLNLDKVTTSVMETTASTLPEEAVELGQLSAAVEVNFYEQQDADAVFDALIANPNIEDDIKKKLFFLQSDT